MSSTWKAWERRVAKKLNGQRRGADYGSKEGGKTDIILPGFSVEVKNWSRPTFGAMLEDAVKAEERREKPEDIAFAIMKRKGDLDDNALVCFRLEYFLKVIYPILKNAKLLKELGY